jgi:hypothetical protein
MSRQFEQWIWLKDGKLCLHTENDGYACIRHGLRGRDEEISIGEAAERYPEMFECFIAMEKLRWRRRDAA